MTYLVFSEFSNVWETAYDVVDQTFNCELNRTGTADNKMVHSWRLSRQVFCSRLSFLV